MDPSGRYDPVQICSFCQASLPTVAHLFHAADGPSIWNECVKMLAEDLRAYRG